MVQPVPGAMKSGTVSLSAAPPAANAGIRDAPKSTPATANGFKDANVDIAGLSREIQTLFCRIQSRPVSKVNGRSRGRRTGEGSLARSRLNQDARAGLAARTQERMANATQK